MRLEKGRATGFRPRGRPWRRRTAVRSGLPHRKPGEGQGRKTSDIACSLGLLGSSPSCALPPGPARRAKAHKWRIRRVPPSAAIRGIRRIRRVARRFGGMGCFGARAPRDDDGGSDRFHRAALRLRSAAREGCTGVASAARSSPRPSAGYSARISSRGGDPSGSARRAGTPALDEIGALVEHHAFRALEPIAASVISGGWRRLAYGTVEHLRRPDSGVCANSQ